MTRVTDKADDTLEEVCERIGGLTLDDAQATPYLLCGTVDAIVDKLRACRDRWGITYFVVRERDAFAEVIRTVSDERRNSVLAELVATRGASLSSSNRWRVRRGRRARREGSVAVVEAIDVDEFDVGPIGCSGLEVLLEARS